ncbi:MAG: hypothetical protein K2L19_01765 [Eubacterium sp.]|nr:hypothetical protein [Eubacterium sp.]
MAELKVSFYLIKDGEIKKIDKLSDEDIKIMSERGSRVMSEYFTQHPQEFLKLGRACKA